MARMCGKCHGILGPDHHLESWSRRGRREECPHCGAVFGGSIEISDVEFNKFKSERALKDFKEAAARWGILIVLPILLLISAIIWAFNCTISLYLKTQFFVSKIASQAQLRFRTPVGRVESIGLPAAVSVPQHKEPNSIRNSMRVAKTAPDTLRREITECVSNSYYRDPERLKVLIQQCEGYTDGVQLLVAANNACARHGSMKGLLEEAIRQLKSKAARYDAARSAR